METTEDSRLNCSLVLPMRQGPSKGLVCIQ